MIDLLVSSSGTGIGMAVGGIAAVLVLSAIFYLVGRGEDRDRASSAPSPAEDSGAEPGDEPGPPEPRESHEPPEAPAAAATRSRAPRVTRRRPRR